MIRLRRRLGGAQFLCPMRRVVDFDVRLASRNTRRRCLKPEGWPFRVLAGAKRKYPSADHYGQANNDYPAFRHAHAPCLCGCRRLSIAQPLEAPCDLRAYLQACPEIPGQASRIVCSDSRSAASATFARSQAQTSMRASMAVSTAWRRTIGFNASSSQHRDPKCCAYHPYRVSPRLSFAGNHGRSLALTCGSEKGTVRGTLAPVLDTYGMTFRVMHGYGSATAVHDAAEQSTAADKPWRCFMGAIGIRVACT